MAKESPTAKRLRREIARLRQEVARALYDFQQIPLSDASELSAVRTQKHLLEALVPEASVGDYDNP